MDGDLWKLGAPWWQFILRGLIVFGFVLVFLRLSGKRQVGQMTPIDLVLLLLISNAVQNAMNGGDNSITAGAILAATLLTADVAIGALARRSRKVEVFVEGRPELLIHNGKVVDHALERVGMTHNDLMAGLRACGVGTVQDVHAAVLENNGRITVLERKP
jgi:uncharacterized membrane protein YcaP (DUF421 family)